MTLEFESAEDPGPLGAQITERPEPSRSCAGRQSYCEKDDTGRAQGKDAPRRPGEMGESQEEKLVEQSKTTCRGWLRPSSNSYEIGQDCHPLCFESPNFDSGSAIVYQSIPVPSKSLSFDQSGRPMWSASARTSSSWASRRKTHAEKLSKEERKEYARHGFRLP